MTDRTLSTPRAVTPRNGNKETEADSGNAQQEFRQNHSQAPPNPQELTAEWTVRAQLTFARAGEQVRREFSSNDPVNPVRVVYKWSSVDATATSEPAPPPAPAPTQSQTEDVNREENKRTLFGQKRHSSSRCSEQSTPLKQAQRQQESFRSTTSSTNADYGGGDSAFSGSNASKTRQTAYNPHTTNGSAGAAQATAAGSAAHYGTRCRSTCNITLSAVADFLPASTATAASGTAATENDNFIVTNTAATRKTSATDFIPEEEPDPFVFNTTSSYTVFPEKSFDESSHTTTASKNFTTFGKILALRDAFSQTSDTETKYFEEKTRRRVSASRSPNEPRDTSYDQYLKRLQQHRKPYERRATAEGLLQTSTTQSGSRQDDGNSYMPSFTPSPTQTFKSASMSRIPPVAGQSPQPSKAGIGEAQKKPRTVHIDVYCTGSEDEDHADAEASSTSSEDEGSKRHDLESNSTPQTVLENEQMLLRHHRVTGQALPRRFTQPQQPQQHQSKDLNVGHGITKSSTAEEVSESKQLLFRKHVGDQRATKLLALRQKYLRQSSDDALSLGYPDSSRSTVRDATCSSISSTVPSSYPEASESAWKEVEEREEFSNLLRKSDSFDYENSMDRLRIYQMERFWARADNGSSSGAFGSSPDDQVDSRNTPSRMHPHPHLLQPISEGTSQRSSPFRRDNSLPSGSDCFSETDNFNAHHRDGQRWNPGAVPYYQRHLSTPSPVTIPEDVTATSDATPPYLQQTSHFPRNRPGFLQFFGPPAPPNAPDSGGPLTAPVLSSPTDPQMLYPPQSYNLQRWKSETRENLSTSPRPTSETSLRNSPQPPAYYSPSPQRCGSEAPPTTTSALSFQSPIVARRFEMHRDSPSASEASTVPPQGYTTEYLEKARKFGKVVAARKPGHHVGPTKNPNCSCDSCQRWLLERFQPRSRAFSLGERPALKRPST